VPDNVSPVRPALRTALLCALLFAGTVLVFSRASNFDFLDYDDPSYLTDNPQVQAGPTWESVVWAFTAPNDYWHPLSWLSHMVDWRLYGRDASGHHLTSLGWHGLNAVLVFFLLRRFTGASWVSLFGAALFAWHPLRVESVVWITERKDLVSGCFFLLTLLAYTSYADRRRTGRPAAGWYGLALLLFAAGLMSKPMLVSLPLVLLVLDFWPLGRMAAEGAAGWRPLPGLLWEKIPFLALSLVVAVITVLMQNQAGALVLNLPLGARLGNAVVSVLRYMGKFIWPSDLAVCYPHPGYWPAWAVTGSALGMAAVSWLAWRQRARRPWLLAGWLWLLVTLLPVIGLLQAGFQAMADRYSYLPLIGVVIWLAGAARELPSRRAVRAAGTFLAVTALAACAGRTWSQQAYWRDTPGLFAHALEVTGPNPVGEALFAYASFSRGDVATGEQHALRSLEFDPNNASALYTLAGVREVQGRPVESAALLRRVLGLQPRNSQAGYQLALVLLRLGRRDEALPILRAAGQIRPVLAEENLRMAYRLRQKGWTADALVFWDIATLLAPDRAEIAVEYGLALLESGKVEAARDAFRAAVSRDPSNFRLHAGIGFALLAHGQPEAAVQHLQASLAGAPGTVEVFAALGRAESQMGRFDAAAAAFERGLALAPEDPVLLRASAEALARLRRFPEALARYQRAVAIDPADASGHAGLGYLLYFNGRRQEAIAEWRTALQLDPRFPGLRDKIDRAAAAEGN